MKDCFVFFISLKNIVLWEQIRFVSDIRFLIKHFDIKKAIINKLIYF